MLVPVPSILVALCTIAAPPQAHKFWIEAEDYAVPAGAPVAAAFRNGEVFEGSSLGYIPARSARFDMVAGGARAPVPARVGDDPAFEVSDGLPVQVFLDAAPLPEARLEIFEKDAQGGVVARTLAADGEGRARLPVSPGREYLVDPVRIEPLEPASAKDPVWMTSWASLTFAVPGA